MAVISITILEFGNQGMAGLPKTVSLSANLPATIFYTLDGTAPTTNSSVYVGPIAMPTAPSTIVINIYATNGTDSSAIITKTYGADISKNRLPHASVTGIQNGPNLGMFGSGNPGTSFNYNNPANSGITQNAAGSTVIASGNFDSNGNPIGGTDLPLEQYSQIYSTTDSIGQKGKGIGNLPGNVNILPKQDQYGPESQNKSDRLFNPRALVTYQDSALEKPDDPVQINREFMSLENQEVVRDGALLFSTALDSPTVTGGFLRSYVNPRDNTITYYYFDSSVGRWLISKQPFPQTTPVDNLSGMVFGREKCIGKVYAWRLFARRSLF